MCRVNGVDAFLVSLEANVEDMRVEFAIDAEWWQRFASEDAWWRTADAGGVEEFGLTPGWTREFRGEV
jgi:hypothetical protein